ncbi:hypothetical protein CHUAL_007474 [Chamberlinius hualienensis]
MVYTSSASFGDRESRQKFEERITTSHTNKPTSITPKSDAVAQPSNNYYREQHYPPYSHHDRNSYYYQMPGYSYSYRNNKEYHYNHPGHGGSGAYVGYGNHYDADDYHHHIPDLPFLLEGGASEMTSLVAELHRPSLRHKLFPIGPPCVTMNKKHMLISNRQIVNGLFISMLISFKHLFHHKYEN